MRVEYVAPASWDVLREVIAIGRIICKFIVCNLNHVEKKMLLLYLKLGKEFKYFTDNNLFR